MRTVLLFPTLTGCKEDCVHMCQRMETWLNECGLTWEDKFSDEGWSSIDDCYDAHVEAGSKQDATCRQRANKFDKQSCW